MLTFQVRHTLPSVSNLKWTSHGENISVWRKPRSRDGSSVWFLYSLFKSNSARHSGKKVPSTANFAPVTRSCNSLWCLYFLLNWTTFRQSGPYNISYFVVCWMCGVTSLWLVPGTTDIRHRHQSMKPQVEVKSMNHRPTADCAQCHR